jgi:hypothetical protein
VTFEGLSANQNLNCSPKKEPIWQFPITGQNADTLYHVDTFAPPSRIYGLPRLKAILSTVEKRMYYSSIFLGSSFCRQFLLLCKGSINFSGRDFSLSRLVESIATPIVEHTLPFHSNTSKSHSRKFEDVFRTNRRRCISDIVYKEFARVDIAISDNAKATVAEKTFLIKLVRWCRTVFNVPISYHNSGQISGDVRLLPYQEGPMVSFLMARPIRAREIFFVKHLSSRYFRSVTGNSYRFFVRPDGYSLVRDIVQTARLLNGPRKEQFDLDQIETKVKRKELAKERFKEQIQVLGKMISDDDKVLKHCVQAQVNRNYIESLYARLTDSCAESINRSDVMELCRFVNMHNYMRKLFSEFNS